MHVQWRDRLSSWVEPHRTSKVRVFLLRIDQMNSPCLSLCDIDHRPLRLWCVSSSNSSQSSSLDCHLHRPSPSPQSRWPRHRPSTWFMVGCKCSSPTPGTLRTKSLHGIVETSHYQRWSDAVRGTREDYRSASTRGTACYCRM
jgi:hypothetical protein